MGKKELVVEEVQKLMHSREFIRNIAIVAHVDHGKCVSGTARLVLSDGAVVTAKDLYDTIEHGGVPVKLDANEKIYSAKGVTVFSLNKANGRIEKKRATHGWKLKGGKTLKLKLRNGFEIETTPEHKYVVLNDSGFADKPAEAIRAGDAIVCPKKLAIEQKNDLKETILQQIAGEQFYVYLKEEFARGIEEELKEKKLSARELVKLLGTSLSHAGLRFCFYNNRFRASDFLELCKIAGIPPALAYDGIAQISYRSGNPRRSKNSKPMKLPQNFEDFFFLAGLLFGDGSGDKLVVGKPELGKRFVEILCELGITPYYRNYSGKTPEIGAGSKTLSKLLGVLFGYPEKRKSHNIKCTNFVFTASDNCVASFMRGYFDCDGTVEHNRRAISLTSVSDRMLGDVQLLLLRFNCASIKQGNTLYITGNSVKRFNDSIGFSLQEKIRKARQLELNASGSYVLDAVPLSTSAFKQFAQGASMASVQSNYYEYASGKTTPTIHSISKIAEKLGNEFLTQISKEELSFIEVTEITESHADEVYDFTVEDNHNFVAEGMFIHNTTMTDSLVARAGLISRELAGQQRMLDFDEQEQARGITIKAAYISLGFNFEGKDYLINLIDTPGHVDFGGHVTRAMRAVDGIILVVDAVEGVMPQTETVLRQSLKEKAKPAIFINKIDRLINELKLGPEQMQEKLIKIIANINKLISQYASPEFRQEWQVEVEKGNIAFGSAFHKWAVDYKYMKKTGFNFKTIYEYCARGDHATLVAQAPLDEVILGMVVAYHPNPIVAQKYRVPVIWKGDAESENGKGMILCDANGKVCMVIFGVVIDEHAGEVGVGRVFSGTIRKGTELFLASRQKREKVQQVGVYMGPDRVLVEEVPAGNIVAVVGLHDLYVGETASEEEIDPFEQIKHYSEPVVTKSIEAKNTKDLVRLIEILRQTAKEDPTIKIEINPETGEHLISGMGELHLEIIEYKIRNEKKCEIETSQPIVVYRETVSAQTGPIEGKSPNKHTKLKVIVEPLEEGVMSAMSEGTIPEGRPKGKTLLETFVKAGLPREEARNVKDVCNKCLFIDSTKGIQYLDEIMELLLQGFRDAVNNGPLAHEKVTGVKVKLVDALIHEDPVHRGPAQIIPAIRRPIYAGMLLAGVNLLEPKQKLLVQCPQDYMSAVITQIQGRRGQVGDIQQDEEVVTVNAKVPVADMFGFANDIRGATQGRAIWYTEYAGYEKMPRDLQNKLVPQIRERKGEPKEPPTAQFFMD